LFFQFSPVLAVIWHFLDLNTKSGQRRAAPYAIHCWKAMFM
jgi:hypothetical protein